MKKKFIIVGNFEFPEGNASGKRVYGISKILSAIGYELLIIGNQKKDNTVTHTVINGIDAYALSYPQNTLEWLSYKKKFAEFKNIADNIPDDELAGVILYGAQALSFWAGLVRKWTIKKGAKFFVDCPDWWAYSMKGFLVSLIKKHIHTRYLIQWIWTHADGNIVISRFFNDYFTRRHRLCVMVPPVFDTPELSAKYPVEPKNHDDGRVFIYAGFPFLIVPGRNLAKDKERLDIMVELFAKMHSRNYNFHFHIYGISREDYLIVLPEHKALLDNMQGKIEFHGKVTSDMIRQQISNADFTVLIRDSKRMTDAGFPTKIAESISLGVPVLCNLSSNISDYVKSGENGIILSSQDMETEFERAILISDDNLDKMKRNCRERNPFDYRCFLEKMENFLRNAGVK